jgi:DNA polymerase-3 subunit gamma/tau
VSQLASQPVPHQAIYRRWRAQRFAEIVGQEAVVETLRNAVRTNRVSHAVLFVGPRGTGKTSLARILAKSLNCTNLQDGDACDTCPSCVAIREGRTMDLVEIDAASNRGIDAIRDLRERINYAPTELRRKVYILDEAHQITRDAWNALLKSLEEPPEFVAFMFASTQPQDFPPAILSRLQRFDVRRLTTVEIEGKLRRILAADGRAATDEAIHLIARLAGGGMRDAESILDQLLSSSAEQLDEAHVRQLLGLADAETVNRFVNAVVSGDVASGIRLLDEVEERGRDLRGLLDQAIEAIRVALVSAAGQPAGDAPPWGALVRAARRLAAIDPTRAGVGGLRLQLELALFPDPGDGAMVPAAEPPRVDTKADSAPPARPQAASTASGAMAEAPSAPEATPAPEPIPASAAAQVAASPAEPEPATTPEPETAPQPATTPEAARASSARDVPALTPSSPDGPPGDDLSVLRARWSEVVTRISAHPPTKPLIVQCRPISVEDGVVTLGFPEDKAFMRDLLERRRPILEEHISAVLGRSIAVRCVATNIDVVPGLPTDEEAAFILAEARRIFADDAPAADEVG